MNYKKEPGIYILTNKINGKVYVGETMEIKRRMKDYKYPKHIRPIESAILKYGIENFQIEIEYFPDFSKNDLLDLEEELIKRFNCLTPKGYNICSRGNDLTGIKRSEESKKKQSITVSGSGNPMYGVRICGEDNSMYGKKRPEMSERQSGINNHMYGKTGKLSKTSKKVNQYTKDGVFIKQWDSATDIKIEMNVCNSEVGKVCKGKVKSAGGYIWKYALD